MTQRKILKDDAVMFVSVQTTPAATGGRVERRELLAEMGVWIAVEDEGVDADRVSRVLLRRIGATEQCRAEVVRLYITDSVEERVANALMKEEPGEAKR